MKTTIMKKTKEQLIEEHLNSPFIAGEHIDVKGFGSQNPNNWGTTIFIRQEGDNIFYKEHRGESKINKEFVRKSRFLIGANPFSKTNNPRVVQFQLESILFSLGLIGLEDKRDRYKIGEYVINEHNYNPFIFDSTGKKVYYQRPFVWMLEDKQLLIESIYNNIDCGKILIRLRGWGELEELVKLGLGEELSFMDIVDGKQRINAIVGFINNEFPDLHGNFYSDLSDNAQRALTNNQLFSYSELPENTPDMVIKEQFLKLNFAGVPQSKEHIEFVKSINL